MATAAGTYRPEFPLQDEGSRHARLPDWRNSVFVGVRPYRERLRKLARIAEADPNLKPMWRQLRDFFDPEAGRFLDTSFCHGVASEYSGDANLIARDKIINSKALEIIDTCAAGLKHAFTSAQKPWFLFSASDKELADNITARLWLDATRDVVRDALAGSNFYDAMSQVYREASIFGVAVCLCDPDPLYKFNFVPLTIGEFVVDECARGRIDTCYVRMEMTAKQIKERFGMDNEGLTDDVRKAMDSAETLSMKFVVFRAMQQIGTFGQPPVRVVDDGWKYETVYFLDGDGGQDEKPEPKKVLRWEWHRTCPFIAVRWRRTSRHAYGTSPGKRVLPEQKSLQLMEENYMNAVELQTNMPTIADAETAKDIKVHGRIRPGMVVPENAEAKGMQGTRPLMNNYQPNFQEYRVNREDVIDRIKQAFFYDQWRAIAQIERQMTAFEVDARLNEKIAQLAPIVESFTSQLFTPILERAYSICLHDLGLIYPPPEILADREFRIEYEGDYSKSIKQVEVERIAQFVTSVLNTAAPLAQLDPEQMQRMLASVKMDEVIRYTAKQYDVAPEIMRDAADVDRMMQAAAQASEQRQTMETIQQGADVAATLGKANMTPDAALGRLFGGSVPQGSMYAA